MTDLYIQCSILYHLYQSFNERKYADYSTLKAKEDLFHIPDSKLQAELMYLISAGYINRDQFGLELSSKGVRTTDLVFKKFVTYVERNHAEELCPWINTFDYHKNDTMMLISQVYFFIHREPQINKVFRKYVDDLQFVDNVDTYQVNMLDTSTLIDNIFFDLEDVNRLFQNKFKCKLFCTPLRSQSVLHNATKKGIDFTEVVATIGTVIHEICHNELLPSKQNFSVNKIKALLDHKAIKYNVNTISTLRTLYSIRNKTFPLHEAGPDVIEHLSMLNIRFPIVDLKDATYKILQAFDSCLNEIKQWF